MGCPGGVSGVFRARPGLVPGRLMCDWGGAPVRHEATRVRPGGDTAGLRSRAPGRPSGRGAWSCGYGAMSRQYGPFVLRKGRANGPDSGSRDVGTGGRGCSAGTGGRRPCAGTLPGGRGTGGTSPAVVGFGRALCRGAARASDAHAAVCRTGAHRVAPAGCGDARVCGAGRADADHRGGYGRLHDAGDGRPGGCGAP